ncbi:hypothetical protein BDY19DRAFT_992735 [Irpex rosettiformis]|uniref:Uncharacterized protein n=1 Tax=Irpex rosettiformis TaxID=378272 RepID=A0ACB8U5V2_9APHY|nr:hypothetical protein BDY19DRAFT_992735 [Irpex rosettiformis]
MGIFRKIFSCFQDPEESTIIVLKTTGGETRSNAGGEAEDVPGSNPAVAANPAVDEDSTHPGAQKPTEQVATSHVDDAVLAAGETLNHDGGPVPTEDVADPPTEGSKDVMGIIKDSVVIVSAILDPLSGLSSAFPPLKAALVGLKLILEYAITAEDNKKGAQDLAARIEEILQMLSRSPDDPDLTRACQALSSKLEKVVNKLGPIKGLPTDRALWNKCVRFVKATVNAGVIQDCITTVDKALSDYQLSMIQHISSIVWKQMKSEERNALSMLKRAEQASFRGEDRPQCLEGTRGEVMDTLQSWALSESGKQFFWLNGPAGSGKSTIAQTFAYKLHLEDKLGASFFCSRNTTERRDLFMIFPTLAFQLATSTNSASQKFRDALLLALKADPHGTSLSLKHQLQELIVRPAQVSAMKAVIVIDALDECSDSSATSNLLSALANIATEVPSLKFFIASRREYEIHSSFYREELSLRTSQQALEKVPAFLVNRDVELFLKDRLQRLVSTRHHFDVPTDWPPKETLRGLTEKSDGLFIFASTVLKFVEKKHYDPRDQLDKILADLDVFKFEGHEGLDRLYMEILKNSIPEDDDQFLLRLLPILGLLVVAEKPLSSTVIANLLGLTRYADVLNILDSLHALINVPEHPDEPIRFHHKSFPDFLTDNTRCIDPRFQVNRVDHHFSTSRSCLVYLMKTIYSVPRYTLNASPSSKASLTYSYQYWGRHLLAAEHGRFQAKPGLVADERRKLDSQVSEQMSVSVLLIEMVGRAAVESPGNYLPWLRALWQTSDKQDNTLLGWIKGKHKFILFDIKKILQRIVSEYDSHPALPLSESIGRLARRMIINDSFAAARAKLIIGALLTTRMPNEAYAVEYSHDGSRLAIGGENFVQLVNPITGEQMNGPHIDRSGRVRSLAFSHDDRILAVAFDNHVILWNATRKLHKLEGLSGSTVMRVAFYSASDATGTYHLLSIDNVGHVWLWVILKLNVRCESDFVVDNAGERGAACWIPGTTTEEKVIAVGSRSGHVELRNITATGSSLRKTLEFPDTDRFQPKSVDAVAISRDGTLIAAGSDNGIVIYYVETGAVYHFEDLSKMSFSMYSLAFSPQEGPPVVAFTCDNTVGLLSKESGFLQLHRHDEFSKVWSIAFSPNDNSIASVSRNLIIGTATEIEQHHYRAKYINFALFSLDGRFVVSGSDDGIVRVWDATDGTLLQILEGHSSPAKNVIFLSDDRYILSHHEDGKLILWDRHSRQILYSEINILSLANFPFTDGNLGFFARNQDSNEIYFYRIHREYSKDVRLELMARSSPASLPVPAELDDQNIVARIRQETDSEAQNVVVAQLESGVRFTVPWTCSEKKHVMPEILTFQEQPVSEIQYWNYGGYDHLVGDEEFCYQDEDHAWVLDHHSQRVLWVPPIHRGHCRWRKGKLLIEGSNGRLTLVDFHEAMTT